MLMQVQYRCHATEQIIKQVDAVVVEAQLRGASSKSALAAAFRCIHIDISLRQYFFTTAIPLSVFGL